MALDTATIIRRLNAAASQQKDNEAQNIINGASDGDLAGVDAEGVLRLYEALAMGFFSVYSARDSAAVARLKAHTQFQPVTNMPDYGVDLVRNARSTRNWTLVTAQLVTNIYAAEYKRLDAWETIGIDGSSIGRGQLTNLAYTDVKKKFGNELKACATRIFIAELLASAPGGSGNIDFQKYEAIVPANYSAVIAYPAMEDFVVAAYLAIKISDATKAGRTADDTARFGVAVYHGMFPMVSDAQSAVGDAVNWSPVAAHLQNNGHADEVAYVNEVVK